MQLNKLLRLLQFSLNCDSDVFKAVYEYDSITEKRNDF